MRRRVKIFRNFPAEHVNIFQRPKKGERVKDFQKKSCRTHQIFPKFSCIIIIIIIFLFCFLEVSFWHIDFEKEVSLCFFPLLGRLSNGQVI